MDEAKILVIDDEKSLLDLLRMSLELEGYDVITAENGEEGVKKFKEHQPDLVICDIIMPKMDGYETLARIKTSQKKWTPFIMLSAIREFEKISKAYDGNADFYLIKPVDPVILLKNIKTLLNLSRGGMV
jgi:DNA-binding response OmpR family regulator